MANVYAEFSVRVLVEKLPDNHIDEVWTHVSTGILDEKAEDLLKKYLQGLSVMDYMTYSVED